jgi:cell filamentation protein
MNKELDEQLYIYPGTSILRNNYNIREQNKLDALERQFVAARVKQPLPSGNFDLRHLQAIHKHLFQDIYPWAGQPRRVPLNKGGSQFMPPDRLEMGMADIHKRLVAQDFLRQRSARDFARAAGEVIGDINHLHPFREGNGRTQLIYLRELGEQASHTIDLSQIHQKTWLEASRQSHFGEYDKIARAIEVMIKQRTRARSRTEDRSR